MLTWYPQRVLPKIRTNYLSHGIVQWSIKQIQDWEERLKARSLIGNSRGKKLKKEAHVTVWVTRSGRKDDEEWMDGLDLHSTESPPGAQHLASDDSKQEVVVEFDYKLVAIVSQKAFKKLQTLLKNHQRLSTGPVKIWATHKGMIMANESRRPYKRRSGFELAQSDD
ncbi:hypothetical protein BY996DRAFT_6475973 [Phakopsora pachyrhizi]|nr:hypothetical protein BY996DRAFT_6475973 [Phakopsora pachyrhizi]